MAEQKLTAKQEAQYRRFAQEYIITLKGPESAILAGYSEKTAYVQSSRMLKNVKVQEFIQEYMKKREKRTEITSDRVLKELSKLAFGNIKNMYDDEGRLLEPHELEDDVAVTINSFKSRKEKQEDKSFDVIEEYKTYDKIKSLELIARHLGMFTEKVELTAKQEVNYYAPTKNKDN